MRFGGPRYLGKLCTFLLENTGWTILNLIRKGDGTNRSKSHVSTNIVSIRLFLRVTSDSTKNPERCL